MSPNTYLRLGHNKILHLILVIFFWQPKKHNELWEALPIFSLSIRKRQNFLFLFVIFFLIAKKSTMSCRKPCPKFLSFTRHSKIPHFICHFCMPKFSLFIRAQHYSSFQICHFIGKKAPQATEGYTLIFIFSPDMTLLYKKKDYRLLEIMQKSSCYFSYDTLYQTKHHRLLEAIPKISFLLIFLI